MRNPPHVSSFKPVQLDPERDKSLRYIKTRTFLTALGILAVLSMMFVGITWMPVALWMKIYLGAGTLLLTLSCLTFALALSDKRSRKAVAQAIDNAVSARMIRESDMCLR